MVRSYTFLTDGRRQVDAFHIKDDVFGLDCGTEYSLFAEAVCDCTVISYQLPTLEMLARSHERFSDQLLSCMIRNFVRSQEHKRLLAGRTAIAKISAFLLTQAQNSYNGYVVNLLMNQYDLADYLGITVETISRTLATMKHRKIIDFSTSHDIELLCIENLHQLCN